MACAKPVVKYSVRVISIKQIPFVVERATRLSMYGTPGPVYIELPADVSQGRIDSSLINYYPAVEPLPTLQLSPTQ